MSAPNHPLLERMRALSCALVLASLAGCGSDGPEPVTLSNTSAMDPGVVTLVEEWVGKVEDAPQDGQLRGQLGLVYEANKMFHEAEQSYAQAVDLLEDGVADAPWRYRRAIMLRENGDPAAGLELMIAVSKDLTRTPVIQARLGDMLMEAGRVEEAEAAVQHGIDVVLDPGNAALYDARALFLPALYVQMGRFKLRQDEPAEAVELAKKALEINPEFTSAHYVMGTAYQALGKDEDAARELELGVDTVKVYPPDPHFRELSEYAAGYGQRMGRIERMIASGNTQQALIELEPLLVERPEDGAVLNLAARANSFSGNFQRALELLEKSVELKPDSYQTQVDLAIVNTNLGQLDEALAHADEAVRLGPEAGQTHYFRGLILMQREDYQESLEAFKTAQTKGCKEPALFGYMAQLCTPELLDHPQDMKQYADLAVQELPGDPTAQWLVAEAHANLGDMETARTALAALRQLAPTDPRVAQLEAKLAAPEEQD